MNNAFELSNYLQDNGVLHSPILIESFNAVDRKDFVPFDLHSEAYEDYPLYIGKGQTISQPYTVAFMLELLQLKEDDTVLDIGCGSGWTSALLAHAVKKGSVTAIERIPELLAFAKNNLKKYPFTHIRCELAQTALGKPGHRFDKILVSAAAPTLPVELIEQLNPNGILVIPINDQISVIYKQADGTLREKDFHGFRFVPLIY